jgi:hypothetical protein
MHMPCRSQSATSLPMQSDREMTNVKDDASRQSHRSSVSGDSDAMWAIIDVTRGVCGLREMARARVILVTDRGTCTADLQLASSASWTISGAARAMSERPAANILCVGLRSSVADRVAQGTRRSCLVIISPDLPHTPLVSTIDKRTRAFASLIHQN